MPTCTCLQHMPTCAYLHAYAYMHSSLGQKLAYEDGERCDTDDAIRVGRAHCCRQGWEDDSIEWLLGGGYRVSHLVPCLAKKRCLVLWGRQVHMHTCLTGMHTYAWSSGGGRCICIHAHLICTCLAEKRCLVLWGWLYTHALLVCIHAHPTGGYMHTCFTGIHACAWCSGVGRTACCRLRPTCPTLSGRCQLPSFVGSRSAATCAHRSPPLGYHGVTTGLHGVTTGFLGRHA